ncbi:hypothetical protein F5877DRAFT_69982 [Lentinula edodes]|nr:hypothetical protein F5877DRAFT_69982 [Lentinula edodes]
MALIQSLSSVAIPDWVQVSRSHSIEQHLHTSYTTVTTLHASQCKLNFPRRKTFPVDVCKGPVHFNAISGLRHSHRKYRAFEYMDSRVLQCAAGLRRGMQDFVDISNYILLYDAPFIAVNSYASRTAMSIYTSFSKSAHSPRHIKFGNPTLVFIYGELLVQLVIHGLAWKRTIWDLRQYYSYPPPALLSVLNRDSLKVFMGISVAMAAVGVATLKIFFPVTFIFPLFISLVSALVQGCRTILNLQRLDALTEPGTSEPHKEPELTTIDNSSMTNWDAAWDSTTFHMEDSHPHRDTR